MPWDSRGVLTTGADLRLEALRRASLYQDTLSGGSVRRVTTARVWWQQMYAIGPRQVGAASLFYNISCPSTGTIQGVGGAANRSAYADGIPLDDWESLWYIIPVDSSSSSSLPGNFRVASYQTQWTPPDNAVLIAFRDGLAGKRVVWGDGPVNFPWIDLTTANPLRTDNGAVNLGSNGGRKFIYRYTMTGEIQMRFRWYYGGTGIATASGDYVVTLPLQAASEIDAGPYRGQGMNWLAAEGGWAFPMQPFISAGASVMYFEVPRRASDSSVARARCWLGNTKATGVPWLGTGYNDQAGTVLEGHITYQPSYT